MRLSVFRWECHGFAHLQETHQERVYSSLAPGEFSTCSTPMASVGTNAPYDSLSSQNYLHSVKIRRPKTATGHLVFRHLSVATGHECRPEDQRIGLHLWSRKKWDLFFEAEHDRRRSSAEQRVGT
jgi:hypothetical protein